MKFRRFICAMLTLILMFGILSFPVVAADTMTSGDFEYEMYDDSSVIITGYKRNMAEKLVIPSTLDGYTVKAIGENAFADKKIYQVTLPDTLEVIEDFAFWNTALSYVKIPRYTSYVGIGAFSGGLFTEYYVAKYNQTYRAIDGVLYNSSGSELLAFPTMAEFHLYADTKEIAPYAFFSAFNLKDIQIPAKVDYIGEGAFMYSSVESVNVVDADYIDHYAFYGCENLASVKVSKSTTSVSPFAFEESAWLNNQPEGLICFNDGAMVYMYKGTAPEKLELEPGVYAINGKAFAQQQNVREIIIPKSVNHIDFSAFDECYSLERIVVDEKNSRYKTIDGMLYSYDETKLYVCPAGKVGSVTVSNKTVYLEDYTFEYCKKVTDINLPYNVKHIGKGAFYGCEGMSKLVISSFVETLGDNVFYGCSALEDITIPGGITIFCTEDFLGTRWYELQPEGILYLCDNALGYKGNTDDLTEVTLKEGTVAVADGAFFDCKTLNKVTLPDTLKNIGEAAFANCPALSEITLPVSIAALGDWSLGIFCTYNENIGYYYSAKVEKFTVKGYVNTVAESYAGFYDFEFISLGEAPVSHILGDADGNYIVNIRDATAIQKHVAGLITLANYQYENAEFNGDGTVNIRDATAIQKHLAGIV